MRKFKELVDSTPPYLLALAAISCFILAMYFSVQEKVQTATLLFTVFLVCSILSYLPKLESIKAFGVEAKLIKTLDRAEEILEKLKNLSVATAQLGYWTLAWNNRLRQPSAREKRAILAQLDDALGGLKVNESDVLRIKAPLLAVMDADFHNVFLTVLNCYIKKKHDSLYKCHARNPLADNLNALTCYDECAERWRRQVFGERKVIDDLAHIEFSAYLQSAIPSNLLDDEERGIVSRFAAEVISMRTVCRNQGKLTEEAAEFCDRYYGQDGAEEKMKYLFGATCDIAD